MMGEKRSQRSGYKSLGKIAFVYRVGMGVRKIRFESGASCFELLPAEEALSSCFTIDMAKEQRRVDWGIKPATALCEMRDWGGRTTGRLIMPYCSYDELPVGEPEQHFGFPWEDPESIAFHKASFCNWGASVRLDHGSLKQLGIPQGLIPNAADARRMAQHLREEESWKKPDPFTQAVLKNRRRGEGSRSKRIRRDRVKTVDSIMESHRTYLDDLASKIVRNNRELSIELQRAIEDLVVKEKLNLLEDSRLLPQDQSDQPFNFESSLSQQRQNKATKPKVAKRGGKRK